MVKTRKVQKTGGSTLTVSLPKEWVEDRIEEGDSLFLEKAGNQIKLSLNESEQGNQKVMVKASNDLRVNERRMVAAYLNGYDEIKITNLEEKQKFLHFIRNNLTGMEITKIEEDSITVKNLFKSDEFPLKNGLRRMNSTILTMMEDLLEDPEKLKEMDDILDRYYLLLLRQLVLVTKNPELKKEMSLDSTLQTMDYRLIAKYLERIGDHLVNLAEMEEVNEELITDFISIYENISKAVFSSNLSVVEREIKRLESIGRLEETDPERIRRLMLDICETTVNFSLSNSRVLEKDPKDILNS